MALELSSSMFSGPCFGDSTPSETSPCASPIDSNASTTKLEKPVNVPAATEDNTPWNNDDRTGSSNLDDRLLSQEILIPSKTLDVDVTEKRAPLIDLGSCGATPSGSTQQGTYASSPDMDLSDPLPATDPTQMVENPVPIVSGKFSPRKEYPVSQVLVCAEDLINLGASGSFPPGPLEHEAANSSELGFLENYAWTARISPELQSDISLPGREDGDDVHHEVELTAVSSLPFASASHAVTLDSAPQDRTLLDSPERLGSSSELATPLKDDVISEGALSLDADSPTSSPAPMPGMTQDWTSPPTRLTGSPDKLTHSSFSDSPEFSYVAQTSSALLGHIEDDADAQSEAASLDTNVNIDSPLLFPTAPMIGIKQHSDLPSCPVDITAEAKYVSGYINSTLNEDDYAVDIPASSPPSSSPCASKYFPSSSPLPSSSPAVSAGTPPTSPLPCTEAKNDSHPSVEFEEMITLEPRIEFGVSPTQTENAHEAIPVIAFSSGSSSHPPKEGVNETARPPFPFPVPEVVEQLAETGNGSLEHLENIRIPGPKRSTLAAQKVQHKKLAKPFRPLTLVQPPPRPQDLTLSKAFAGTPSGRAEAGETTSLAAPTPPAKMSDDRIKHRTSRAAAQFKSPLSASMVDFEVDSVRPTPNIQLLERKLQLLKRAVRARENSEEEELERLIKKWTEAGREIAWEVWDLVKDHVSNDSGGNPAQKRGFQESWGWEDAGDAKKLKTEERNWGWDVVPVDEREAEQEAQEYEEVGAKRKSVDDEDAPRHNLGAMLRELGIATEVLGWSEAEESFVDL